MKTFKQYIEEKKKSDPCWKGYVQAGVKDKGGKKVPNCIPEEFEPGDIIVTEDNQEFLVITEAEYRGKEVTLNSPTSGDIKKSKVYVKDSSGKVKKVEFGDPNMKIKKHIPANKKSYCARSSGAGSTTDKTSANYWSRKAWNC